MTEKLQNLMHERAAAPDFPVPDLASVRSAGLRRRRRHRAASLGGGVVAVVAVAAVAVTVVRLTPGGGPDAASDPAVAVPSAPTAYAYALGDVIHDGDREIRVEHPVRAFVRTDVGYVTADDQGRVWSVVDGREDYLGVTDSESPRLVSDPDGPNGSLVAFFDVEERAVVAHDQADGTGTTYDVTLETVLPSFILPPGHVYALDSGRLYVRDGTTAVAIDMVTGERTQVDPEVREDRDVLDVAAGEAALIDGYQVALGATRDTAGTPFDVASPEGQLSPDAAYFALTGDDGPVYDTATGRPVELSGVDFYEPYLWADATTVVAATEFPSGSGQGALAACDVVRGSCEVEVELGPIADIEDEIVLATGTT